MKIENVEKLNLRIAAYSKQLESGLDGFGEPLSPSSISSLKRCIAQCVRRLRDGNAPILGRRDSRTRIAQRAHHKIETLEQENIELREQLNQARAELHTLKLALKRLVERVPLDT